MSLIDAAKNPTRPVGRRQPWHFIYHVGANVGGKKEKHRREHTVMARNENEAIDEARKYLQDFWGLPITVPVGHNKWENEETGRQVELWGVAPGPAKTEGLG